jgi:hypothetical protein
MPTTCVLVGECSQSHAKCPEVGKPCPGGMAGDMCAPPVGTCAFPGDSCDPTLYESPIVPIAELPGGAKALLDAVDLTEDQAGFSSPLSAAVKGTLTFLRKRAAAPDARPAALVLVTEARKAERTCAPGDPLAAMADLAAAARANPPVPTYVIGLVGGDAQTTSRENLAQLATAGGAATPFVLDNADQGLARFQEALGKIRSAVLPCDLAIPAAAMGQLDYQKVNVTLVGSSSKADLGYVGKAAACGAKGGWYYDVDPSGGKPSRILLCPESCQALKGDPAAKAELVVGCATRQIE